jgi:acylphosphatase
MRSSLQVVVLRGSSYNARPTFHVESPSSWYEVGDPMALERRRILYSGNVQGVGFRWRTESALRGLPIAGYVKNLHDGRVELVLEGSAADNEEAARRVREALGRYIQAETHDVGAGSGEFRDFGIRR